MFVHHLSLNLLLLNREWLDRVGSGSKLLNLEVLFVLVKVLVAMLVVLLLFLHAHGKRVDGRHLLLELVHVTVVEAIVLLLALPLFLVVIRLLGLGFVAAVRIGLTGVVAALIIRV